MFGAPLRTCSNKAVCWDRLQVFSLLSFSGLVCYRTIARVAISCLLHGAHMPIQNSSDMFRRITNWKGISYRNRYVCMKLFIVLQRKSLNFNICVCEYVCAHACAFMHMCKCKPATYGSQKVNFQAVGWGTYF